MTSLREQIVAERILMSATPLGRQVREEWGGQSVDVWRCTFQHARRSMTVRFYMGEGLGGARPLGTDVMESLLDDAVMYLEEPTFEGFCAAQGVPTDDRRVERMWRACGLQTRRLLEFLGDELFERLAYETERD